MATLEPRRCEYCQRVLVNEWLQFIEEVYLVAGLNGMGGVACANCYREKINPIITEQDLDELTKPKGDGEA